MISVHPCRNKLFKARNWIWRGGRRRESEERKIQTQRWKEKRGGWNQPIWKRWDRKSLWQPGIMRFGSLRGFLFTWKGINIKKNRIKKTHTHCSPFCSHLFQPSLLQIHRSLSQWFQHLVDQSSDCLFQMESLFTWFEGTETKTWLGRVI